MVAWYLSCGGLPSLTSCHATSWSSVNHLHFQVLTLNDLFTKPAFPVESAPRTFLWDCQPPPADDDEEADGADTGAGGGAGAGAPSADDNTVRPCARWRAGPPTSHPRLIGGRLFLWCRSYLCLRRPVGRFVRSS